MTPIFHITSAAAWDAAQEQGAYTADSLATEGFIHCSEAHQVIRVANLRFAGRTDLVLLHIDPAGVRAEIRYENLEGGTELFPHIYGALALDAVVDATAFLPDSTGRFERHEKK